ncbi:hypothetical protein B0H13DRAFT_1621003 [Mycena leptocephala]|nr:hypothetical protein B0H13DRAFT_1621003 [Mycena leptocephala]
MNFRFCNRSLRYADSYAKGMNGREAAYATKIYHSHRSIPNDYLGDFEQSGAIEMFRKLRRVYAAKCRPAGLFYFQHS